MILDESALQELGMFWLRWGVRCTVNVSEISYAPESIPGQWVDDSGTIRGFEPGHPVERPVELGLLGGRMFLWDGYHRLRQAQVNGDRTIPAVVAFDTREEAEVFHRDRSAV